MNFNKMKCGTWQYFGGKLDFSLFVFREQFHSKIKYSWILNTIKQYIRKMFLNF